MGFRNSLVENMNGLAKRSDSGAVIENAVFIRLNELCKGINKLNFWRTKAGAEVDFVLHAGGDIIPVEVKYSKFEREKASRSFTNFVESFNPSRGVVLTRDFRGKMTVAKTEVFLMPVYYL
jgi:predicted AAA+ superfamily ATPase